MSAGPARLKIVCGNTGMGFVAVARVTEGTWTACTVRDDIGFGLEPGGQLAALHRSAGSAETGGFRSRQPSQAKAEEAWKAFDAES